MDESFAKVENGSASFLVGLLSVAMAPTSTTTLFKLSDRGVRVPIYKQVPGVDQNETNDNPENDTKHDFFGCRRVILLEQGF